MCGITALIRRTSKPINDHTMTNIIKNFQYVKSRGPDTTIIKEIDHHVLFMFHRLAIIDPNHISDQPLQLNDLYLICNGEIYNYQYLIQKYNFVMKTKSDCEVILHMYKNFGIERTLKELDAEFVFVLYDIGNKKVYLARDPIGVRPMFTGWDSPEMNYMLVASEAKALHHLCDHSLRQFEPGTYYERELDTGNTIRIAYYNPMNFESFQNKIKSVELSIPTEYPRICAWINYFLTKAVEKRIMSDRPIGCLLSGGLDSSLVVAIMSRYIKDITIFSIGLEGSVDVHYAKIVAKFLELKNHNIVTFTTDQGINSLSDVIKAIESYDTTTVRASTPQYLLALDISTLTAIKAILSGEGSDELFGGYMYNHDAPDSNALHKDTLRLLQELYLYDDLRTDRTMGAHGLEVRPPFLDLDLIALVLQLDPQLKMCTDSMEKKLLRDSFSMKIMDEDAFTDEMNKLCALDKFYVSSYVNKCPFEKKPYLPDEVLYRSKSAFSDAVSSKEVSWYKSIQAKVNDLYSDQEFEKLRTKYTDNTPRTKEELYYRDMFESHYNGRSYWIPKFWMPQWQQASLIDPSATVLEAHQKFNTIIN